MERQERILQRHLRDKPTTTKSSARWADGSSDDEQGPPPRGAMQHETRGRRESFNNDTQGGQITDLQNELRGVRSDNEHLKQQVAAGDKQLSATEKQLSGAERRLSAAEKQLKEKDTFWEMDDSPSRWRSTPRSSMGRAVMSPSSSQGASSPGTPRTPGGSPMPHSVHASMHVVGADGLARKTPLASRHGRRMSQDTTGQLAGRQATRDTPAQRVIQGFMYSTEEKSYLHSSTFAQDIIELSRQVAPVFEAEPRVLELVSPTYVFGDIHGNVEDLQFFQDNLWKLGMSLSAGSFLFLGDYVDRGQDGLEVIAYLFSQKIELPNKLYMLRGNHETRAVNGDVCWYQKRSFLHQCRERFGNDMGSQVHEAVNCVFDRLPLCAVIDGDIFCVHGGIPRPIPEYEDVLQAVEAVPVVFDPDASENDVLCQVVSDCLWSDPATKAQEAQLDETGFGASLRGEDAVCFGVAAVDQFLQNTGLSYIFRAHTSLTEGIDLSKGARVFTIFSTSKDHGGGPEATCGCVLVDNGQIIVINRSPKYNFDKMALQGKKSSPKYNDSTIAP